MVTQIASDRAGIRNPTGRLQIVLTESLYDYVINSIKNFLPIDRSSPHLRVLNRNHICKAPSPCKVPGTRMWAFSRGCYSTYLAALELVLDRVAEVLFLGGVDLEGVACIHAGGCAGSENQKWGCRGEVDSTGGPGGGQLVNARLGNLGVGQETVGKPLRHLQKQNDRIHLLWGW